MVYSILVLFICNGAFALLHGIRCKLLHKLTAIVYFFGRNTLYIWLYHLVVRSFFMVYFPDALNLNAWMRLLIFVPIIIVPAIARQVAYAFGRFCHGKIFDAGGN